MHCLRLSAVLYLNGLLPPALQGFQWDLRDPEKDHGQSDHPSGAGGGISEAALLEVKLGKARLMVMQNS